MKTYSIRVSDTATAGVTSEAMQARLRRFFIDGAASGIAADPGSGSLVMRRTLPEGLVEKFSAALDVPPSSALRRLAASCVRALPAGSPAARSLPPRSGASNPAALPWWAPVGAEVGQTVPADPPSSRAAAISPLRAFWQKAWPELLVLGALVLIGLMTGTLTIETAATPEPYAVWRPK